MNARLRLFLLFAPLWAAGSAAADDTFSVLTHWRCWYNQRLHVTCLLDTVAMADAPPPFPLSNLPSILPVLRDHPAALINRFVHIPLHAEPYEMDSVAALAANIVCGSRPDCKVSFSGRPPPDAEIKAILIKNAPHQPEDQE